MEDILVAIFGRVTLHQALWVTGVVLQGFSFPLGTLVTKKKQQPQNKTNKALKTHAGSAACSNKS